MLDKILVCMTQDPFYLSDIEPQVNFLLRAIQSAVEGATESNIIFRRINMHAPLEVPDETKVVVWIYDSDFMPLVNKAIEEMILASIGTRELIKVVHPRCIH